MHVGRITCLFFVLFQNEVKWTIFSKNVSYSFEIRVPTENVLCCYVFLLSLLFIYVPICIVIPKQYHRMTFILVYFLLFPLLIFWTIQTMNEKKWRFNYIWISILHENQHVQFSVVVVFFSLIWSGLLVNLIWENRFSWYECVSICWAKCRCKFFQSNCNEKHIRITCTVWLQLIPI